MCGRGVGGARLGRASGQGRRAAANRASSTAAANLVGGQGGGKAGSGDEFRHVSFFYSTVFGLTYEFLGDMSDFDELVIRGSFEDKNGAALYLKDGVLKAAFLLGRPYDEHIAVEQLIAGRQRMDAVVSRLGA